MKLRFEELPGLFSCRLFPASLKGNLGTSSIDTRTLKPGDLFWALPGVQHDGHAFVTDAVAKGAQAAVVSEAWFAQNGIRFPQAAFVVVEDPLQGLQELAQAHRRRAAIPVIALTGSNGKTSTKEMVAAALAKKYRVLKSEGNYNNHIGVPLTLLRIEDSTEIVVTEMGTNHPGEIAALCSLAEPTAGLVLNVGAAHLEGFGSIENVAREKAALYESLPPTGAAFFNLDDPYVEAMNSPAAWQVGYGFDTGSITRQRRRKIAAQELEPTELGQSRFQVADAVFQVSWPGAHQRHNALAAVAVAMHFKVGSDMIAEALANLPPLKGRLHVQQAGGITILDDSYNANPASTRAALDFLASLPVSGRRIAVLGDHLELGLASEEEHRQIGKLLLNPAINGALLIGDQMRYAWAEFSACGKMAVYYDYTEDYEDILEVLCKILKPGDAILIKASRGMGFDRIAEGLQRQLTHNAKPQEATA